MRLRLHRRGFWLALAWVALGLVAWSTVAGPGLLRAQTTEPRGVCARLSDISADKEQKFLDRLSRVETERSDKDAERSQKRADKDIERAAKRAAGEAKLADNATALLAVATTDAQVAAVATFVTEVETAREARTAAVNDARAAWHQEVDGVRDSRRALADDNRSTHTGAVQNAIAEAEASCNEGVRPFVVNVTLKASLTAAKDELTAANDARPPIEDQVAPLFATFTVAKDKAFQDYTDALQAAKDSLKAAFAREAPAP